MQFSVCIVLIIFKQCIQVDNSLKQNYRHYLIHYPQPQILVQRRKNRQSNAFNISNQLIKGLIYVSKQNQCKQNKQKVILIGFKYLSMNANRPYSKSLRLFVHKSPPIQLQINRFIKRSPSFSKDAILYQFPQLKMNKNSSTISKKDRITFTQNSAKTAEYRDKSKQQALRQTNQSFTPKITIPSKRYSKEGRRTNMEQEIDQIMNQVIISHSPRIKNNTIMRSISTKKFKNVRIITEVDQIAPTKIFKEAFIKEIIDFMRKNSKTKRKKPKFISRDEPSLNHEELNQMTPNKLIKKSQQIHELHPIHEFKHQQQMFMNKPLNSQTYIRQLRSNKMFVKQVQLKKY